MTLTRATNLKKLFAFVILAVAITQSNTVHSKGVHAGLKIGAGQQYSGILGPQVFLGYERIRVHAGIGVLILSVGADVALAQRLSTGVFGYVDFGGRTGRGGHLSYHFNSAFSRGFEVGITVNTISPSSREPNGSEHTNGFISVGYQF